jgi:hypothetical protein
LKIFVTFFTKQATLMRRSTVLSLPPQLVFSAFSYPEDKLITAVSIGSCSTLMLKLSATVIG